MPEASLSRRSFLKVSGGAGVGLLLSFPLPPGAARASAQAAATPAEFNAWIRVDPKGFAHFRLSEVEMGQGVFTAIPMILAEELEIPWQRVHASHAPVDPRFGTQQTGGSRSIRQGYGEFRRAAAAAREMLIRAAAQRWGVDPLQCKAHEGAVQHPDGKRKLGYGELAEAASALPVPADVPLKERRDFRIIGQRIPRLDTPAKVEGSAIFGLDVQREDMRVALVERPPTLNGRLESFDASDALAVEGVERVLEIDSGVAVVARSTWPAVKGRRQLRVQWQPGESNFSDETVLSACQEALPRGLTARDDGDVEKALGSAARTLEARYRFPYLAHATMEPMNCTAHVHDERCEIWAPTQSLTAPRDAAARITGLPPERVSVQPTFLGGGFGRRSATDFVEDAVQLSMATGTPVKVMYSREDDMRAGLYRPTGLSELAGAVDAEGWPVAWRHRMASPSILRDKNWPMRGGIDFAAVEGARNLPYAIPNLFVSWADVKLPVTTHWWRSVGSSHNAWVTECFFDELCRLGGVDPLEARLKLLGDHDRHRRVLEVAAEAAGYGTPLPAGRARGIAVHESFGSFVAQVAEVSLASGGRPRVHRVVCAIDCGEVVNPDTVEAQMEGGIAFGLSAALHGAIHFQAGRVVPGNFDSYPLLRMREMPRVETHIVAKGDPMGGVGEPGTPPVAPAVCNALLALGGEPVRQLPIGQLG